MGREVKRGQLTVIRMKFSDMGIMSPESQGHDQSRETTETSRQTRKDMRSQC